MMPRLFALHCLFFCLQHALVFGVVPLDPLDVKNTDQKLQSASHLSAADWTVIEDETLPIHVDDGLTFSRDIQKLDASFELHLEEGHCKSHDKYGDNNCHYKWGDAILGNYTVVSPQLIDEGDTMMGDFRIDLVVPYQFTCHLCGERCVLEIPVIEVNYSIAMPPCPIGPSFSSRVREKLNAVSPTDGIRTHLSGIVQLTKATGETIAEFTVSAYVK